MSVKECPVCSGVARSLIHDDLTDLAFGVAPGEWSLFRCYDCGSAYLDPIPSEEYLPMAYETYHTHTEERSTNIQAMTESSMRSRIAASYLGRVYGFRQRSAVPMGWLLVNMLPFVRHRLDRRMGFFRPPQGRLLDIGFGAGRFMDLMQRAGWQVMGVDFDPVCVTSAKASGTQCFSRRTR